MIVQIVVFFRAKLMLKERKILRFVSQKLRKSFAILQLETLLPPL